MTELPPERDLLAEADATIRAHWVSAGAPWKPGCDRCVSEEEGCPELRDAEGLVDGLIWRSARWPAR